MSEVSVLDSLKAVSPRVPEADLGKEALAEFLVQHGIVDAKNVERARRVAIEGGNRLEAVLTQLGLLSESGLADALSRLLDISLVAPHEYPSAAPLFADRLRLPFLRKIRAVPIASDDDSITLAMTDPRDEFAICAIAAAVGLKVKRRVGLPIDVEAALDQLYGDRSARAEAADPDVGELGDAAVDPFGDDADRLKDLASEAPVIRLVNQLIARAVETRASDIHIEPLEDRLRVRYRYDGVLQEVESPPLGLQAAIVSRIKIMSRLDIAERRRPQDGRIKLAVRGTDIDFRVSTIPCLHGETIVLRVLDRSAVVLDFEALGFNDEFRERFLKLLDAPNGIFLSTGPTGSGKTTTLYTALKHLNSVSRKIITVEDPIEYQLGGITQIQVKPQIGLNFAALLRSILRQDPDIIMIGEIRDLETAQIAVQAALTGHLVLSTLHTNSAAATITRLRDMGVEDYLLSATLNGVIAQRLVRRLCPDCKRPFEPPRELVARLELDRLGDGAPVILHDAVGCPRCRGTGYQGRFALAELLVPTEEVQRLILGAGDQGAIQRAASESGMRLMQEAGLREVLAGTTTLRELARSIRVED